MDSQYHNIPKDNIDNLADRFLSAKERQLVDDIRFKKSSSKSVIVIGFWPPRIRIEMVKQRSNWRWRRWATAVSLFGLAILAAVYIFSYC